MYNRYVPQSDGSFRRSYVPDRPQHPQQRQKQEENKPSDIKPIPIPVEPEHKEPEPHTKPHPDHNCPYSKQRCPSPGNRGQKRLPEPEHTANNRKDGSIPEFLRNLIPKDFDTGDLLIVLMLLLMAGDCKEDQNSALLTLVLYLFM